jgi:excisionase family DNA binding protein
MLEADAFLYSIPRACSATSLGRTKLYEYIAAGKLRACKAGARTVIHRDELERFAAWLRDGQPD